jgi:hypothetical protein
MRDIRDGRLTTSGPVFSVEVTGSATGIATGAGAGAGTGLLVTLSMIGFLDDRQ